MIVFSETEPPVSISQIKEIEDIVGLSFPSEYKNHLLRFNGGKCYPDVFYFIENGEWTRSRIHWFLAIHEGLSDNLKDYIYAFKINQRRLPLHVLPIAHDPFGNLVCISCDVYRDYGYVYFWDHECELDYIPQDRGGYENMYLVAKSFDEFINGLKID